MADCGTVARSTRVAGTEVKRVQLKLSSCYFA